MDSGINLETIDVLNADGTLNEFAGAEFAGMDRFDARKATVEKLREQGDLIDEEDHANNVGFSERADVPIEPRLSEQWFLRYPRVEEAKRAVSEGFIRYFPALVEDLSALAGQYSGLVHQPAIVVGTPDSGLVPQRGSAK